MLALAMACGDATSDLVAAPDIEQAPPNVLLIVIDTLRRDHLELWGGERATAPHLTALAAGATRFDRAFSHAPWTTPSIGTLLSSRYPTDLGITSDRAAIPEEAELLPEVLQRAGYNTGAVVSHSFCSSEWGFDQGFDDFDESNVLGHRGVSAPGVTREAIEFIDSATQPFFLFAHYFDPHIAYLEHPGFEFHDLDHTAYDGPMRAGMSLSELRSAGARSSDRDLEEVKRLYDSEIAFTDHHIGVLLTWLREQSLLDDMLVIVTADHGEEFLDHGRWGHHKTLYNELLRVPLIIRYPGGRAAVVEQPAGLIDGYPTVLDVAGITAPVSLEGQSLRTLGSDAARPIFVETARHDVSVQGVVMGDHKLIVNRRTGRQRLYNYADDRLEARDRTAREPARVRAMRRKLDAWAAARSRISVSTSEVEISDEQRAQLEALGYSDTEASVSE